MSKYKICTKCGIENLLSEFCKETKGKDGLCAQCKDCRKKYKKEYQSTHKEKMSAQGKIYYESNKQIIKQKQKKRRDSHKKEILIRQQKFRDSHKEEIKKAGKIYYQNNKEIILLKHKKYKASHKKETSIRNKEYRKKYKASHKQEIRESSNKRQKIKKATDLNFKILCNLRTRILGALKRNSKSASTKELLGCTIAQLKQHLKSQFTKGMTWKNHGNGWLGKKEWHIDHIIPCASFDLSKASEQKECFHYSNLQPLWALDNLIKGSNPSA